MIYGAYVSASLAEALRGADFSTLEAAHEQVRGRDISRERVMGLLGLLQQGSQKALGTR